ncbi:MAG: hypothetical protein A2V70_16375 [Planctomycetes bacterium RBG_13_63_9]|nr:MAG: hypothetical protein A2V70_16375 [Planctomycetes bacterium RBG_13_63_9]
MVRGPNQKRTSAALLGLAFDNEDGHARITRGENFALFGGSEQTHALMQETAIKVNEHLDKRRKRLEDLTSREFRDICRDATRSAGGL